MADRTVRLDLTQLEALNALLSLVHYDDLASEWRDLLPPALGGRDSHGCCRNDASGLCAPHRIALMAKDASQPLQTDPSGADRAGT